MAIRALQTRHSCTPSSPRAFDSPSSVRHLPSLPLVGLSVLEWEPTCPLVRARLSADPAIATGKQDAPQCYHGQKARTKCAKTERQDSSLGPHSVAVEGVDGVKHGGYGESRQGIWCFWIFGLGRCAWAGLD
jgi:hypothetical protein